MKKILLGLALVVSLCLWTAGRSLAQEGKKDNPKHGEPGHKHGADEKKSGDKKAGEHAEMAPATPSAEHKRLEAFVGTWKADGKFWMPGAPEPVISTGTSVVKPILGGLAFVDDYNSKCETMGDFSGHGLITWNSTKQKYQSTWIDTWSYNGVETMWGTFDEKTNTFTYTGEMMGHDGKPVNVRSIHRIENKDKHVFEMFMPGPDGKEAKGMEITYTRNK